MFSYQTHEVCRLATIRLPITSLFTSAPDSNQTFLSGADTMTFPWKRAFCDAWKLMPRQKESRIRQPSTREPATSPDRWKCTG